MKKSQLIKYVDKSGKSIYQQGYNQALKDVEKMIIRFVEGKEIGFKFNESHLNKIKLILRTMVKE